MNPAEFRCTYVEDGKVCGKRCIKGRLICFRHDLRLTIHGEVQAERARIRREEVEPLREALRWLVMVCPELEAGAFPTKQALDKARAVLGNVCESCGGTGSAFKHAYAQKGCNCLACNPKGLKCQDCAGTGRAAFRAVPGLRG